MTHTSTERPEFGTQSKAEYVIEIRSLKRRIAELEAAQAQRVPLTDEAIRTLYGESDGHWQMVGPQVLCFARSIESVHGITQEKQG